MSCIAKLGSRSKTPGAVCGRKVVSGQYCGIHRGHSKPPTPPTPCVAAPVPAEAAPVPAEAAPVTPNKTPGDPFKFWVTEFEKCCMQHGLIGWSLCYDRAKRRLGQCRYRTKQISLSSHMVKGDSDANIRDTLLHEIAHALVGHRAGHGLVWRAKAIEIGCTGERCGHIETVVEAKYIYKCACREIRRHKKTNKDYTRRYCKRCGVHFVQIK